jgi:OFA family oxalate/formate antiporter-like MFS transporter
MAGQERPRLVATAGGVVLGLGYILAGFTGGSFPLIVLTVGIIGGAGIGFGYVCPIAACVKWFPDKRGLVTGLAVAGFGAGAWLFQQLASSLIVSHGILSTFMYLGVIFLIAVVLGAQILSNPPEGWKPAGWNQPELKSKAAVKKDFEWRDMLRTRQFWMLWLMFVFGAAAGLMVIGNLKPFGAQQMMLGGLNKEKALEVAGTAVGVLALFNGAGRIVWGAVSDRLGRRNAMTLMFLLQGVMMLYLMNMGSTKLTLTIAAAWVGFNFGGNFALFPSTTADYFGTKNVGVNYGFVFTAYGVAGVLGPILGGGVFDMTGSYLLAFIPSGVMCLLGVGISLMIKKPE